MLSPRSLHRLHQPHVPCWPRPPHAPRLARSAGVTLLELLVVLALMALLGTAGLRFLRPDATVRSADAARALLRWARLDALWGGRSVAVVPDGDGLIARASPADDDSAGCAAGVVRRSVHPPLGGRVRLVRALRAGIVWRPDGSALSCAGGGVISDRMTYAGGQVRASLVMSSLGRVRLEVSR